MTKIKLCGLTRLCDIEEANLLAPDYVGFVFAPGSRRYVDKERASALKKALDENIKSVGVFVNEDIRIVADIANDGIIDLVQLHGCEGEDYINNLRSLTDKPIIKAFGVEGRDDVDAAQKSSADFILLDSCGGGTGRAFQWEFIKNMDRQYFLAGGLDADNVEKAIKILSPYAVDVSSGVETDGLKDGGKMKKFVEAVRKG